MVQLALGIGIFVVITILTFTAREDREKNTRWWVLFVGIAGLYLCYALVLLAYVVERQTKGHPVEVLPSVGVHHIIASSGNNYLITDNKSKTIYYKIKSPLLMTTHVDADDERLNTIVVSEDKNLGLKKVEIFLPKPEK